MRIVIIGPTYPIASGISHYNTLLFRELKKHTSAELFSFTFQYPGFLFPGKSQTDRVSREKIEEPGPRCCLSPINPFTWLKTVLEIRQKKIDLVIFHWWTVYWAPLYFFLIVFLKILSRAKILMICHNVYDHESSWFKKWMSRAVLRLSDLYVVHSEMCEKQVLQFKPCAKIQKTFHPTYDVFNFRKFTDEEAKRELKVSGNVILFFGKTRPYKGLKYLLMALPEVIENKEVTVFIVGEFWERAECYQQLLQNSFIRNHVRIVNQFIPNEDIELYFRAADVVVLPYLEATASGVAQIAFAFNKPVIASNVGALSEMIEDSKTGYLVPPADASALAKRIIQFFSQGHKEEFSSNINKSKGRFSWQTFTGKILSFIEENR